MCVTGRLTGSALGRVWLLRRRVRQMDSSGQAWSHSVHATMNDLTRLIDICIDLLCPLSMENRGYSAIASSFTASFVSFSGFLQRNSLRLMPESQV